MHFGFGVWWLGPAVRGAGFLSFYDGLHISIWGLWDPLVAGGSVCKGWGTGSHLMGDLI